jgi:hypothetical protein
MAIDPTKNPHGLGDLSAGQAGWDATIQDALENLAPQDSLHAGNALALKGEATPLRVEAQGLVRLQAYTVAGLPAPSATTARCMAWVSNPSSGGPRPAYCDGTNWRWYADDAVVT